MRVSRKAKTVAYRERERWLPVAKKKMCACGERKRCVPVAKGRQFRRSGDQFVVKEGRLLFCLGVSLMHWASLKEEREFPEQSDGSLACACFLICLVTVDFKCQFIIIISCMRPD